MTGEVGVASAVDAGSISYVACMVNFRAYDDLDRCLASLKVQTTQPAAVVIIDGDGDAGRLASVRAAWPAAHIVSTPNLGYAAGANRALALAFECCPEAGFALLLNPDVEAEAAFAETLIAAMVEDPSVAIATGKLLRPGGELIDSAGIAISRYRRPRDRGSEQLDRGQFEGREYVFAASGAAMMLRREALDALAIEGEVFDEDFFVYYEDTDLCWRAGRLGWRVLYEPRARAAHRRTWRRGSRYRVPRAVRLHSFKNHYLQVIKNEPRGALLRGLPLLLGWEAFRFGFALARDRAVLRGYLHAWRLTGRALAKRRALAARIARAQPHR